MTAIEHESARLRPAEPADLHAIISIAKATGQPDDWNGVYPSYVRHVMTRGTLIVAERSGGVAGFGATLPIGTGQAKISMLTDLFVDPAEHGTGIGRAVLGALWSGEPRRMTFSSLHANALPLYTSFGVDAWWPLLYLRGDVRRLAKPDGWSVSPADPAEVGALEHGWTGFDRRAEHEFWAGWPGGSAVVASRRGHPVAAGTVRGAGADVGIWHLAVEPPASGSGAGGEPGHGVIDPAPHGDTVAADAVIAVLSHLDPLDGLARVCLPGPHPATRPLLAAGWRVEEFDLHMASEFGLIDARALVPAPSLA